MLYLNLQCAMSSARRFVCTVPSGLSFEQELSEQVIGRSIVLQNALAAAYDGCAILVLPQAADNTFFDCWLASLQPRWRGHEKSPEELVDALQAADFFADVEVRGLPACRECRTRFPLLFTVLHLWTCPTLAGVPFLLLRNVLQDGQVVQYKKL